MTKHEMEMIWSENLQRKTHTQEALQLQSSSHIETSYQVGQYMKKLLQYTPEQYNWQEHTNLSLHYKIRTYVCPN